MRISVIVPTYNEEKIVGRCLKAIRAQEFDSYELIVVDGHSKDRTVEIARKYSDRIFFDSGRGAGNARNIASKKARGEILAFTDADTTVCKNWLSIIDRDFKKNKNLVGLSGPLLPLERNKQYTAAAKFYSNAVAMMCRFVPYFSGSNSAYSRAAFMMARGFREDLYMLDDVELSMKMGRWGTMEFDKELYARTSMRRFRQEGYMKPFLRHAITFFAIFFGLNANIGKNYLREVKR